MQISSHFQKTVHKEWEAQGIKTNIVNVNSLSDFSTELLSGETILRYEASNGVLVYQFPIDRFVSEKIAIRNVADLNGRALRGAKTVFPASWDEHKILSSIGDTLSNGEPVRRGKVYSTNSVYVQVGIDDISNRVITGFPKVRD